MLDRVDLGSGEKGGREVGLIMKTTSVVEWVTDREPEGKALKLVALKHRDGTRITSFGTMDSYAWRGDNGHRLDGGGWCVEAWADLPLFEPFKQPVQHRQPLPKPY